VKGHGSHLSQWLYGHFTHPPEWVSIGGSWALGDSPLVLLTALSSQSSRFSSRPARAIGDDCRYGKEIPGRSIGVYELLDARLTFDDMEALLKLMA
jgi:hypothetical protein